MAKTRRRSSPLERHLGVKDAAKILGIPVSTMKSYGLRGLLPRIKFPGKRGKVVYAESDLLALLHRHRENGKKSGK